MILQQTGPLILTERQRRKVYLATAQPGNDGSETNAAVMERVSRARKAIIDINIRLLVRGNKKPTFLDASGSDSKKHTISAEKQQAVSIMRRIYVGSINFNVTEDMLKAAFSAFGPVRTVNMSIDVTTNRHKGFAFIEMETPEAAFLSMAQMNGVMLGGRNIKVGRPSNMPQYDPLINQLTNESKDYARIYVCSIDPELSEQDVQSLFNPFGTIKSMKMPSNVNRPTAHCGYAYIEFDEMKSAEKAISSMNMFQIMNCHLRVGKAVTPPFADTSLNEEQNSNILSEAAEMARMINNRLMIDDQNKKSKSKNSMHLEYVTNDDENRSSSSSRKINNSSSSRKRTKSRERRHRSDDKSRTNKKESQKKAEKDSPKNSRSSEKQVKTIKNMMDSSPENKISKISENDTIKSDEKEENIDSKAKDSIEPKIGSETLEDHTTQITEANEQDNLSSDRDISKNNSESENDNINFDESEVGLLRGIEDRHVHMRKLYRNVEQKVVLLQNIIDGDEQVDDELHAEIQEECMRHASVKKVVISVQEITMAESEGNPAQLQNTINVFVELASNEDAKKLLNVMSGRYFAGRRISARLYDQELYDQNHLKI